MTKETKVLVAAKGFSANGVSVQTGEVIGDQFDAQVVKVLKSMGRVIEVDADEVEEEVVPKGKQERVVTGKADAPAAPAGLPGVNG